MPVNPDMLLRLIYSVLKQQYEGAQIPSDTLKETPKSDVEEDPKAAYVDIIAAETPTVRPLPKVRSV